jgi:hypothetical protein
MRTIEQITFDYRVNDLCRIYPDTTTEFRAHVVKSMGDVDHLGYAQEFIRLKERNELLKAYREANPIVEEVQLTSADMTMSILKAKYVKE